MSLTFFGAVYEGLGQHAAHVVATGHGSPDHVVQLLWVASTFYDIGITFVKLSALAFYYRIFGDVPNFRIALIVTGTLCLLWFPIALLTGFFTCSPFHDGWAITTPGNAGRGRKCLNNDDVFVGTAAANVALDLVILVLPHFQLWRLQLGKHKKWGLALIFLSGYAFVLPAPFSEPADDPLTTRAEW